MLYCNHHCDQGKTRTFVWLMCQSPCFFSVLGLLSHQLPKTTTRPPLAYPGQRKVEMKHIPGSSVWGLIILCPLCCQPGLESRAGARGLQAEASRCPLTCPFALLLLMKEALGNSSLGTAYILQLAPLYFPCDKGSLKISPNLLEFEPPEVHILPTFGVLDSTYS